MTRSELSENGTEIQTQHQFSDGDIERVLNWPDFEHIDRETVEQCLNDFQQEEAEALHSLYLHEEAKAQEEATGKQYHIDDEKIVLRGNLKHHNTASDYPDDVVEVIQQIHNLEAIHHEMDLMNTDAVVGWRPVVDDKEVEQLLTDPLKD